MIVEHYYVVIVGSGPAGLGLAEVLKKNSILPSRTLILEKGKALENRTCAVKEGKKCTSCNPCNIMSGVGGAGPYTDGKICLYPQNLNELLLPSQEKYNEENSKKIEKYLDRVKELWSEYGVKDYKEIEINERMERLKTEALKHGINYVCYPVLHIGSDGARGVIESYIKSLTKTGIKLQTNSKVISIKKANGKFEITYEKVDTSNHIENKKVTADFLVLALGREMQKTTHINQLLKDFKLTFNPGNIEIGCRVEVPYQIMEEIIQITFDPKFKMSTPTYQDSVRTFCTCHRGKVVREQSCVNGHIDRTQPTQNTNFAILVEWPLDHHSLDDAMEYGNRIAQLTLSEGKGKPIIQRVGDLKRGIPSTKESIKKSHIKPTLRLDWQVTPGSIDSCYPRRIVINILEGLEKLDSVVKGVNDDQNLLYAPEIKPTCAIQLKEGVKTEIPNLYICGDFSGYTRGIAQAMCMGMMVGEDILREGFQQRLGF